MSHQYVPARFRACILAGLVLLIAAAIAPAAAQESIHYASVSGRVIESSGGVVRGVQVSARQIDTNVTTTVTSDQDGRFRFPYLRVGAYEVSARLTGFKPVVRQLTLTVGAAFEIALLLEVGPIETVVTVMADGTVLEAARSQMAGTIGQAEVRNLPLNGRNVFDLALLIPGVSLTNVGGGTQLFPETSAVPGVGLSIGSQRNLSNNFIVDGLSANDDAASLGGMVYGIDAVDQFQVVTSGGQAELGRALGGYVNIVTKSGTNEWHGDAYSYVRDDRFNASNALSGKKLPMHQVQIGVSAGGPLARNRTFAFTNVERKQLDQTGLVTILPENAAAINLRLAAVGYRGPGVTTGLYVNPIDTTTVVAKVDHVLNERNHLTLRYSLYDVASSNARGAGGLSAPSAAAGLDNRDQSVAAGHVVTLSDRTVLETRGQVASSSLAALPTDGIGPAVSISGVAAFGTLSGNPTGRTTTMAQVVSNLSHQAGAHALRVGVDVLYNTTTILFPRAVRGSYTFSSLANFLAGTYSNAGFTQTFGESSVSQRNPNLGLYAQDEWKATPGLTLNAGVRYDLQWLETISPDANNVSPRVGVVWTPRDDRRTLVRANAGLFFDRVPLRAVANAILSAGNTTELGNLRQTGVTLSPAQAGAPVFPNILPAAIPSGVLPNLTTMDRHLQNAYSRQFGVEVEHQVSARGTASIGYQHLRGERLIMAINQNVPTCVASGTNNGCRPVSSYANNSQYSSAGSSQYDGLHLSWTERPSRWGSYRLSYTYSKSMNNVGEAFFSSPIDPADLSKDWGRSDDDQRHRLVVVSSVNTPVEPGRDWWERITHGFRLSGMMQYSSALPFNILSGVTTVQGTAGRPVVGGLFIGRNTGEGSAFSTVSLRLARTVTVGHARVEALVEAFNLLNRRNDIARNSNFGSGAYPDAPSSTFGQVTVVGEPRSFQFGLRAAF